MAFVPQAVPRCLPCTVRALWLYSCCFNTTHFQQHQIFLLHHTRDQAKNYNYWFIHGIPRCEQEKNVSAPLSACVTKTVGCIHFYLCAIRLYQLQCIKEGSYSSKKSISLLFVVGSWGKKKMGYTSISPFLLFAPGFNFQDLYSHSNSTATAFWGKKTTCEGKDSQLC